MTLNKREDHTLTDETLIEMIKEGRQSALLKLYQQCFEGVRNFILKNQGVEEDAEDILQDALVVTWQKVMQPDFILSSRLSTFVQGIARNLWLNRLKKLGRQTGLEQVEEVTMEMGFDPARKIDQAKVRQALDQIGESCKKLLSLFYFDGMNMDQIALVMDMSNADTAKARKYQCLKKLGDIIKARFTKDDFLS